jgi:translation initiation factor 2 gamma subunit (eIF-2gamma)
MTLKHILILQNKIDLVKEGQAKEQYKQIVNFLEGKKCSGTMLILSQEICFSIQLFSGI